MRRKFGKNLMVILLIIAASLLAVYIGLAFYYRNAFVYGTWINGVYCTGRSVEEVNEELVKSFQYEGITVYDKEGNSYPISAQEIDYRFDFAKALKDYLRQQDSWIWIDSLFRSNVVELAPVVSYDGQKLEACIGRIPHLVNEEEERRVFIEKTDRGYELVNERAGILDEERVKTAIESAVENSVKELFLESEGCYRDLALTEEMQETLLLWDKLKRFQACDIVYQMGDDRVSVDASVVCDWILTDEDGNFLLDGDGGLQLREGAVAEFIDSLAQEYDTVGGSRFFLATRGELVVVEGGIYGNKLDRKKETEYLTAAFLAKKSEVHEPEYSQKAFQQGKNDIGRTYIEIDMENQMLYYYVDGARVLETPVVTGNTSRRMGTPSGVNYVYNKQKNRILRGEGYASHVDFWMPVKGNIGIHDAAWRSQYGGKIYRTNGSHGCINTPRTVMEQLYEAVEIGTPVVMFY